MFRERYSSLPITESSTRLSYAEKSVPPARSCSNITSAA
jgi:hypothetical protein